MAFFNQYSYLLMVVVIGAAVVWALWRWRRAPLIVRGLLAAAYVVAAVAFSLAMRYPSGAEVSASTAAEVEQAISDNQPTLVMLYSNY